jgi:hypothetical protein
MIASPVIAGLAAWLAPSRLAPWIIASGIIGGLCGLVVHCRDWYLDLKRYVRQRDEFNRRLSERS